MKKFSHSVKFETAFKGHTKAVWKLPSFVNRKGKLHLMSLISSSSSTSHVSFTRTLHNLLCVVLSDFKWVGERTRTSIKKKTRDWERAQRLRHRENKRAVLQIGPDVASASGRALWSQGRPGNVWASKRLKHLELNAPTRVEDRRYNTNLMGREKSCKCMFYVCLAQFTPLR